MSDLISRQDAIDAVKGRFSMPVDNLIAEVIGQLPSAQPERKTGRWEERQVTDDKCIEEWQSARCSVCGKYHTTPYMYYFDNYKYCPNCGAKMDGKKFEEPTINPCRGCEDYDGYGGCKSNGGCGRTETEGKEQKNDYQQKEI